MTHRRASLLLLVVAAFGAAAAPAHAGSYSVFACGSYDNRSWNGISAPGIAADEACPGTTAMGNTVRAGARVPLGATGTTTFTAPAGMTIADFTLTRQLTYRNGAPADGTRRLFAIYKLGSTVFAGAGHYENATRDRLNALGSWYGYPEANVVVPRSTVRRASFPALAGYRGDARTLQIAVGCFNGTVKTACTVAAGGGISHLLSGAQVVLSDPTTPAASIEASGLLAGGQRSGADPITLDATDNGGIRRVEILDVTASGASVVGAEDYATGSRTDAGATCSFRLRKACPNLKNDTVRPTGLPAGPRTLKVRIFDAGGNVLEQGPYAVNVATPSDRGSLNGSGATEDGTLSAHFTGTTKTRRTVNYGARVRISGRLVNSAGQPITGALLRVLTRDRRQSARFVERYTATTGADGGYRVTVKAGASRLTQIAWRSHTKDPGFQESAYVTLDARATSSLTARPRTLRVGRRVRLSGTVKGTIPSRGVPLIFQGRSGTSRYTTFADGRANRRGHFSIRYRFRSATSRGRTFSFRVKLRGDARFPYASGYSKRVRVRVR
ncbi:MAG: hypothetical protein QOD44_4211 [Solirubrobacteraceae bacterium]|nr:hypothetical protein [Solirubrobacteraceae bacterium]